ncbi:MAG: hypothetical protein LWX07_06040 [Bacteroidetes bacterium]|nr:hypothetical protein [Bacteroidota bacterium]
MDFTYGSYAEMSRFINECIKRIEKYIGFLSSKGKIFLPMDLTPYDAAIEVSSEIFTSDGNTLVKFKSFFDKLKEKPDTEDDYEAILKSFLFSVAKKNLVNIYKDSDPVTARIIRNLNLEIDRSGYFVTELFSDRFVHTEETDFSEKEYCGREELEKILSAAHSKVDFKNAKTFLSSLLNIVNEQDEYIKAVSFGDLVYVYKHSLIEKVESTQKSARQEEIETNIHYKFILEEFRQKFNTKLRKYFSKKNFSDNDQKCMYNVIDAFLKGITDGGQKRGASELTKEFFADGDFARNKNRVEYCIDMLLSELTTVFEKGK